MKSKETIILLAIIALLGAFIYFYERHTSGTEEKARRADKIFPDFKRDKVTKLEIKSAKGTVVLQKQEAAGEKKKKEGKPPEGVEAWPQRLWQIVSPTSAAADQGAVDGILSELEFLGEERRVEGENARNSAKFGLDKPRITVRITMGKKPVTLTFGKDAPGEGIYLRSDDRAQVIYVVSKFSAESFMKDPADLRDRQLTDLLPELLVAIRISVGGSLQSDFRKTENRWTLSCAEFGAAPVRVSRKEVRKLGSELASLRAVSFLADRPDDKKLADYGIGEASTLVELEERAGRKIQVLLGKPCGGETKDAEGVSAYVKDTKTLACVSRDIRTLLDKPHADYRLLTPAEFDEFEISAFEAYEGEKPTLRIEKSDAESWQITKPRKEAADAESVTEFITFIRNEKAGSLLQTQAETAAAGLAAGGPRMKFIFLDDAGKPLETVLLARGSGGAFYFQRPGESSWGGVGSAAALQDAWKPLHFGKKSMMSEDYYDAVSYSVEKRTPPFYHKLIKDKEKGQWSFEKPAGLSPDPADVSETIETLASLTAQRLLDVKSDEAMARYGLVAPAWTIKATFSGEKESEEKEAAKTEPGERTYRLLVGDRTGDGYAALLEGQPRPVIFLITQAVLDRLTRPLCSRAVFQIDASAVQALTLTKGKSSEQFEQKDGSLRYQGGTQNLFDASRVQEFLQKLTLLRAEDVTGYGPPPPGTGLSNPVLKVQLVLNSPSEGETRKVFSFGSKMKPEGLEEQVYASVEGLACTYTVGADLLAVLGM